MGAAEHVARVVDEEARWRLAEIESIKVSLQYLQTFPFVKEAIKDRHLTVLGIYFDLEQGQLWEYDDASNQFKQLEI